MCSARFLRPVLVPFAALAWLACSDGAGTVDPVTVDEHKAFQLTGGDLTCVFRWSLNGEHRDGKISYDSEPEKEDSPGMDYFFDLSSDAPKRVWTNTDYGSSETEFVVLSRTPERIVLFSKDSVDGGAVEFVTIWNEYGTAIWTKHRSGLFRPEPYATLAIGSCVD
jgi:hypothetical protein